MQTKERLNNNYILKMVGFGKDAKRIQDVLLEEHELFIEIPHIVNFWYTFSKTIHGERMTEVTDSSISEFADCVYKDML